MPIWDAIYVMLSYSIPYSLAFTSLIALGAMEMRLTSTQLACVRGAIVLIVAVFFIFRGYVFTDFVTYHGHYQSLDPSNIFDNSSFSPAYSLAAYLAKSAGLSFDSWMRLLSLLRISLLFLFFKRYLWSIGFGFALMISLRGLIVEFNLWQNFIAMLIFFLSIKWVVTRSFVKFFCALTIASFFHASAVLYMLLLPALMWPVRQGVVIIVYIGLLLLYFLGISFGSYAATVFLTYFNFEYLAHFLVYIFSKQDFDLSLGFIARNILFLILIINFNKLRVAVSDFVPLMNVSLLFFASYLIFANADIILDRVSLVFVPAVWVLFSRLLELKARRVTPQFVGITAICFSLLVTSTSNALSEYQNILMGSDSVEARKAEVIQLQASL